MKMAPMDSCWRVKAAAPHRWLQTANCAIGFAFEPFDPEVTAP
ncbi:hypothetical protein X755_14350 [Mesorhizobium sp. LNJC405B00]|nr:hypothetical protein X755_14350 [Mesorhizobium sp. LNJC405B00]